MSGPILVPVFVDGDRAAKGSLAVLSQAAALAAELGVTAEAVVVGSELPQDLLVGLGRYGATKVYSCGAEPRLAASWVAAISDCLATGAHSYVLLAGGPLALAVAGGVAARCYGGVITDVTALRISDHSLVAEKPVFRDRQIAVAGFKRGPGIVVARSGAFTIATRNDRLEAAVEVTDRGSESDGVTILTRSGVHDPGRQLAAADVIVTGGRGLGGPERFADIEDLADAFAAVIGESAVGATRAVVDAGWRSEDAQVGLTGRTVSPKLYVAVGVSGAPQHRSGMETSERILAINNDRRAPIFRFSDLGVVFDSGPLLPALAQALRRRGGAT